MIVAWKMASLAMTYLAVQNGSCEHPDRQVVHEYVDSLLQTSDYSRSSEIGNLLQYWKGLCVSSRRRSSREIVAELIPLLRRPSYRFYASSMLSDVGYNLRFAEPYIRRALEEEVKYDLEVRDSRSFPILSGDVNTTTDSLRCVLLKARTGRWDKALCEPIETLYQR